MARVEDIRVLEVLHPICCGLDIHKKSIVACIISGSGKDQVVEKRVFDTHTQSVVVLKEWLLEHKCPIVAMESTGVYWHPAQNVLEGHVRVVLVNARHIKNVPGRKTDIADSQWLAGLLRHGLVRSSFIPPKEVRQQRDIARYRKILVDCMGDFKRRVHRLLQSANIKIDSVVTDLFGKTGRNLMSLLVEKGSQCTRSEVDKCLRGSLQDKGEELFLTVQGFFSEHHVYLLRSMLGFIDQLERQICETEQQLKQLQASHEDLIARLDEVPGINAVSAQTILAEVGPTLDDFDSPAAMASWSGLAPGNNESAGKRHSGKSPVRHHHLKQILIQVAWAAIKKKDSYYRAKYFSLKARLGPYKAIVAIAHRILKALWYIIKKGQRFKDLGPDYLAQKNKANRLVSLSHQARQLGYKLVPLEDEG